MKVNKCRSCESQDLKMVLSLGDSPLANNLLNNENEQYTAYPLELMYCNRCHNCQLSVSVPSSEMFDNYLYVSSTASSFRDHFSRAASKYVKEFGLNATSKVLDIGSNDGVFLKPLKEHCVYVLGVEPAKNIAKIANENGINTINDYFTDSTSNRILQEHGKFDVITASNVFAHINDLDEVANCVFKLLQKDGTFIVEVQYIVDTIKDLTFDNIYHEHVNYWSVMSINTFFNRLGYTVYRVEHIDTHGGSIRVYVSKHKQVESSVHEFIEQEKAFGITSYQTYAEFKDRIETIKANILKNVELLKAQGHKIVGFGAPAKATTALNYFGLTKDHFDYIVEDNQLKHGKFIPGVQIPIYGKDKISETNPTIIIVLAWNFYEHILKNNKEILDKGIPMISIKALHTDEFFL